MNKQNLFGWAARGRWLGLLVWCVQVSWPCDIAKAGDIATRLEGVGQNIGVADVSQIARAPSISQSSRKPFKLLPRPRENQPVSDTPAMQRRFPRDGTTTVQRASSNCATGTQAASSPGSATFTPAAANSPPPLASFSALLDDGSYYNPDTAGAVGPNHVMSIAGNYLRIQDRMGNTNSTFALANFWQGTPGLTNLHLFDGRLLYDAQGGRWIHVIENFDTNNAGLLVAVSRTNDPTGLWNRYFISFNGASKVLADSPNLGLTKDWIVVTANMYERTNFTHFSQDIFVFDKSSMFANGPAQFTRFVYTTNIHEENIMVPSVNYEDAPTSSSVNYLVGNYVANTGDSVGFLALYRLYKTGNTINFALLRNDVTDFQTGTPGWASNATVDFFLPQSGTTNKIDAGDCRIQNVVFRAGPNQLTMSCVQTIFLPGTPGSRPTRSAIQWWEMTTGGTVLQRGRIDDPSGVKFYAYPSIAVNNRYDVLVGYSRFASNQFPSANYSFRIDADMFGTLRNDTVFKAGEASYTAPDGSGNNFWGDWSATVVDPLNDTDLWTLQQYAASPLNGTNRWGTWWARVSPRLLAPPVITGITNSGMATKISFPTAIGLNYVLESRDVLDAGNWIPFAPMPGTGGVVTVMDSMIPATSRFYRMRAQ